MARTTPKQAADVFKGFKGAGATPGKAGGLQTSARGKNKQRRNGAHGTSSGPGRRSGY